MRKREPLTQDEFDYATGLVDDARSPLAFAIPAVLFAMGFFYVVGCPHELHVYVPASPFHVHRRDPDADLHEHGRPTAPGRTCARKLRGIDVTSRVSLGDADTTAGSPSSHSSS